MNRNARNLIVFYLPVGLTPFQRDLTEILVSLHARSFQKELDFVDEDDNNHNDNCTAEYPKISSKQMTYMLDRRIRDVANHPCLLVDHYMPRQFLRMEPTENLITTSDKFQKFQKLLFGFIQRDRERFPDVLKICIISHNVRELDILEGLVLGKRVRIKRLSGTSLYNEKHVFPGDPSDSSADGTSSKDGTPGNESSSNKYTGYSRDDYDYSLKYMMKSMKENYDDWLFLTTSTHLIHDPELLRGYSVDHIIAFDPLLDPSLPALSNLKRKGQSRLPLIKLLVKDSPDHFLLSNPATEGTDKYQYLKTALKHFLTTRYTTYDNLPSVDYEQIVNKFLKGDFNMPSLLQIALSEVGSKAPSPFELVMTKLNFCDSALSISEDVFDVKSYQTELNKRTIERLLQVQNDCRHGDEILVRKRHSETERQDLLDETRTEAGSMFKKFQTGENSIIDSEKRLERCRTESLKLDDKIETLDAALAEAKRLASLPHSSDTTLESERYSQHIGALKIQVDHALQHNSQKNQENDSLRSKYQQESSEAAEKSECLKLLKNSVDQLHKDLEGPLLQIQAGSLLSQERRLKDHLISLKSRSKFLKLYLTKMTSYYGLNLSSNDEEAYSNGTHGQGGRSSVRYRSTRSTTPAYT